MATRCKAKKPDGTRCKAPALTDSRYCFWHDPSRHEEARAAGVRGGQEKARREADPLGVNGKAPAAPAVLTAEELEALGGVGNTPEQLERLTSALIEKTVTGQLDHRRAKVALDAAKLLSKQLEKRGPASNAEEMDDDQLVDAMLYHVGVHYGLTHDEAREAVELAAAQKQKAEQAAARTGGGNGRSKNHSALKAARQET